MDNKNEIDFMYSKMLNLLMYKGKKEKSKKILNKSLEIACSTLKESSKNKVLIKTLLNVCPDIVVKSKRLGSSVYQVPVPLSDSSKIKTGIRILLEAARLRKQSNIILKLSAEIIDAYNNKGVAVKKKEDLHKLSELNKSFSHFNW